MGVGGKVLGEENGSTDRGTDQIDLIRLIMLLCILVTDAFIIYSALSTHHFLKYETKIPCHIRSSH